MLRVFHGNDTIRVRQSVFDAVQDLESAGWIVDTIDQENYQTGVYPDAAGGTSLFGERTVYVVDTPSVQKEWYEDTIDSLEILAESENIFVVIEGTLLAPEKKKFAKQAEDIQEFKAGPSDRFNTFSLADALAKKDKKTLWLLYNEAVLSGIAVEEIVGVLWWQLKSLRLANKTLSATEAGMKDFPYNKAKRSLSKFQKGELETLSNSLLVLQHDSRLGRHDLDFALERWILKLS